MPLSQLRSPFVFNAARTAGLLAGLLLLWSGLRSGALFDQSLWEPKAVENILKLAGVVAGAAVLILLVGRRHARTAFAAGLAGILLVAFGLTASAAVGFMLLSCLALGDLIIGQRSRSQWEPLVAALLAMLAGLAAYALMTALFIGYPINTSLFYTVLLVLPIAFDRHGIAAHIRAFTTWSGERTLVGFGPMIFGTAIVFLIAVHAVHSAVPERYADALALHFLIATTVEALGRWHFDVHTHLWAVMPMAGDFVFTIAHLLGGELAAKLLNVVLLLAIVGLFHQLVRRVSGGTFALGMACLFLSMPIAFIETATLFIENPLTVFILGGFTAATSLWPGKDHSGSDVGRTAMAIFLLIGGAVATKLTGIFLAGPIGLFALVCLVRRGGVMGSLPAIAACTVIVALSCQPYLNAWLLTGNPFFPLLNGIFQSPFFPPENFENRTYAGRLSAGLLYRMTFTSSQFLESANGAMGFQFVLLGIAGLFSVMLRPRPLTVLGLAAGVMLVAPILINTQYIRYVYPAFPLLLLACASVAPRETAMERPSFGRALDRGLLLLLAGTAALNLAFVPSAGWILRNFDLEAVFSPEARRKAMLRDVPHRSMIDLVNVQLGTRARVGIIGNPIAAGLQGTPLFANWYNQGFGIRMLSVTSTDNGVDLMRDLHMTHLLTDLAIPYPGKAHLEAAAWLHGREVARKGSAVLIELDDDIRFGGKPLFQDHLISGLGAWSAINEAPEIGAEGVVIRPGHTVLDRGGVTPVGSYQTYRLSVDLRCDPAQHSVVLQMNWVDAGGQFINAVSETVPCRPGADGMVSSRQESPAGAAGVATYVSFSGTDPVVVKGIVFREGPMAANGLHPVALPAKPSN
jgi:hypothetical protein